MSETLQTEHIDIHDSINRKEWVKNKIAEVYEQSNKDLADLKKDITANVLENKLTMENVKNVLKTALNRFDKGESFSQVYGTKNPIENKNAMSAGLTLSVQIALKKLGYAPGAIDGVYINTGTTESQTRSAVIAFQKDNGLDQDGWAGPLTITKILEKLGNEPKTDTANSNQTKQEQKQEAATNQTQDSSVVVSNTVSEAIETQTGELTGTELANENYNTLKTKLKGMNGETINALGDLHTLQETTKTKMFCFESANQKEIEEMLAPVMIASGDMPMDSVKGIINSDDSGCVSYSIKDIAETLNVVLKEGINADAKFINTSYFKQFCTYLLSNDSKMLIFDSAQHKYIDNPDDGKNFVNVLFAKTISDQNGAEISSIKDGQTTIEHMDVDDAQHELKHAEFETIIANDPKNLKEIHDYFYGKDITDVADQANRVSIIKKFLKSIYVDTDDLSYKWHFTDDGTTKEKRDSFINGLTFDGLKTLESKVNGNDAYDIKKVLPLDGGGTIGTAQFNLFTEFYAYSRESSNPTVNLGDHKFSWEANTQITNNVADSENIIGKAGELFDQYEIIRNNLIVLKLPDGWTKPTYDAEKPLEEQPVIFDEQKPKVPGQEPDNIHLQLFHNNQKYLIDFDKNGSLIQNQELTFDGKPHLVSIDQNKILFTEKQINYYNSYSKLTDVIKSENKEHFKNVLNIINEKDKSDFLNMINELPIDKVQANPNELTFKIDLTKEVNFSEIKTKYKELFKSFSIVINPYASNKGMEVTFM